MRKLLLTGLLTIALSTATLPGTAAAAPRQHCVATVAPIGSLASTDPVRCFATFSEALDYGTGGRVRLAPDAQTVDASTLEKGGAVSTNFVAASSPLLGIEYLSSGYGGSSLAMYGSSGSGCYGGVSYGFSSLGAGWNNTISSAASYSGCTGRHYDNTGYSGSLVDCTCSSMGAMDNRASSILFL